MTLRKEYKEHDYLINTYGSFAEARNDKFHVDERRYSSILKLTANGTLIMGIWSLIKCFMEMIGDMGSEILADEVPLLIAIFGSAVVIAFFFHDRNLIQVPGMERCLQGGSEREEYERIHCMRNYSFSIRRICRRIFYLSGSQERSGRTGCP